MMKKMLLVALALLSVASIKSAENDYRGGYATDQPSTPPPNPSIPSNLWQNITDEQQSDNSCPSQNFSKKVYHPGDVVACAGIPGSNGTVPVLNQTYSTFSSKSNAIVIGTGGGGGGMVGAGSYTTVTVNPNFNGKKKTVTITQTTKQGYPSQFTKTQKYTITVAPRKNIETGSHGEAKTKNAGQATERRALTNDYDLERSNTVYGY